jgi:hypothetical protein
MILGALARYEVHSVECPRVDSTPRRLHQSALDIRDTSPGNAISPETMHLTGTGTN